jgi:hypothetical protein
MNHLPVCKRLPDLASVLDSTFAFSLPRPQKVEEGSGESTYQISGCPFAMALIIIDDRIMMMAGNTN